MHPLPPIWHSLGASTNLDRRRKNRTGRGIPSHRFGAPPMQRPSLHTAKFQMASPCCPCGKKPIFKSWRWHRGGANGVPRDNPPSRMKKGRTGTNPARPRIRAANFFSLPARPPRPPPHPPKPAARERRYPRRCKARSQDEPYCPPACRAIRWDSCSTLPYPQTLGIASVARQRSKAGNKHPSSSDSSSPAHSGADISTSRRVGSTTPGVA